MTNQQRDRRRGAKNEKRVVKKKKRETERSALVGLIKTKEKIPKCMLRRGDTFFVHMCFSAPTAGFLFRGRRERERERERGVE